MKQALVFVLGLSLSLLALQGCKKNTPAPTPKKTVKKAVKKVAKRPAARAAVAKATWLVPAYEVVRKALAADNLKAAQAGAKTLATKAATAKMNGLNKAGLTLASAKDPAAARLAFGELSKHTIAYLDKQPTLKKGLQAYQCPMAKGYKKWLQADADMANPYMGKRMLKCGGKTAFAP